MSGKRLICDKCGHMDCRYGTGEQCAERAAADAAINAKMLELRKPRGGDDARERMRGQTAEEALFECAAEQIGIRQENASLRAEVHELRAKLGAAFPCGWPAPEVVTVGAVKHIAIETLDTWLTPDEAQGIGAKLIELADEARKEST